jgi:hypothetical protein
MYAPKMSPVAGRGRPMLLTRRQAHCQGSGVRFLDTLTAHKGDTWSTGPDSSARLSSASLPE